MSSQLTYSDAPAIRRSIPTRQSMRAEPMFEVPSRWHCVGYWLTNPFRNYLLPARWLQKLVAMSSSPLIAESLACPGGWRAMEIIYRNDKPTDWLDRQALCDSPICMAARNRRRIVTGQLARLIRRYNTDSNVTLLGIGAGPGRHVQGAIVDSGIDPARITAYLIDRDDGAFEFGRELSRQLGIAERIHFVRGDARRIRDALPDISADIIKVVGLAEYLTDDEFLELLAALRDCLTPEGTLLTHGLVDVYGTGRFLARVFGLRHTERNADQLRALLREAKFRPRECIDDPTKIHPIILATREA